MLIGVGRMQMKLLCNCACGSLGPENPREF